MGEIGNYLFINNSTYGNRSIITSSYQLINFAKLITHGKAIC